VSRIAGTSLEGLLRGKAPLVTIGGTSAGNAIQGLWVYTGATASAVSDTSLLRPYNPTINGALVNSLLNVPSLDDATSGGVVTDDHFVVRDRMGRLVVFMARLAQDGFVPTGAATADLTSNSSKAVVRGIGVDEATALLLDPGNATSGASFKAVGDSTAYACELSSSSLRGMTCAENEALTVRGVTCERLAGASFTDYTNPNGDTFDLTTWKGTGVRYTFDVVNGVIVGNAYGP
jgi:cyanophycinase